MAALQKTIVFMQNTLFSKKTSVKKNEDYFVKTTGLYLKSEYQINSAHLKKMLEKSYGTFPKACDDIIFFF